MDLRWKKCGFIMSFVVP